MGKEIRFYFCAAIIAVDGLILLLLLSTIFFARLAAHPLSWVAMAILIGLLLVVHFGFLVFTLFRISILREEWGLTSFGALGAACIFWDEVKFLRYLQKKKYKQNTPSQTVLIIAYPDYSFLEGWVRAHWSYDEMIALCELVEVREKDFSFHLRADVKDVRSLMANAAVRRVYFVGHGSRNSFGLSNGLVISYDEFADGRFAKEYVHQVHCGHEDGVNLIDRVVPVQNRDRCFFFPEMISNMKIISELKKLTKSELDAKRRAAH